MCEYGAEAFSDADAGEEVSGFADVLGSTGVVAPFWVVEGVVHVVVE